MTEHNQVVSRNAEHARDDQKVVTGDDHPICRVPGTSFHIYIRGRHIRALVDIPEHVALSPQQAAELSELIHAGLENVLAGYFLGPEL